MKDILFLFVTMRHNQNTNNKSLPKTLVHFHEEKERQEMEEPCIQFWYIGKSSETNAIYTWHLPFLDTKSALKNSLCCHPAF